MRRIFLKAEKAIISDSLSAFAPLIDRSCSQNYLYEYITIRKLMC